MVSEIEDLKRKVSAAAFDFSLIRESGFRNRGENANLDEKIAGRSCCYLVDAVGVCSQLLSLESWFYLIGSDILPIIRKRSWRCKLRLHDSQVSDISTDVIFVGLSTLE